MLLVNVVIGKGHFVHFFLWSGSKVRENSESQIGLELMLNVSHRFSPKLTSWRNVLFSFAKKNISTIYKRFSSWQSAFAEYAWELEHCI